jgi:acetyl-CoA carboxylase biotin carboxyl carrier protein
MTERIEVEISELRQITSWLAAAGIGFAEIGKPGAMVRLTLEREGDLASPARAPVSAPVEIAAADRVARGLHSQKPTTQVTASSAGVFLAGHPARGVPLVAVGGHVRQGDVVGLLEIAELCAPVLAPVDGVVIQLLATHRATVGYGTPLLELAPSA